MLQNTQYIKIILPSLISLKDENILTIYFTTIMTLSSNNNDNNNNDNYIPEYDIYFFICNINDIIKNE